MFDSSTEYVDSYYAASCRDQQISRPSLQENLQVDVVIVGAGYTGLYTALNLAEAINGDETHLKLFTALKNPAFPGGETLGALFQAVGMSYYRLRDYF